MHNVIAHTYTHRERQTHLLTWPTSDAAGYATKKIYNRNGGPHEKELVLQMTLRLCTCT